jgi:hypothetical protein
MPLNRGIDAAEVCFGVRCEPAADSGRASLSGRPAGLPRNVNRPRPPDVIPAMTIDALAEHGRQWLGGCRADTLTPADR